MTDRQLLRSETAALTCPLLLGSLSTVLLLLFHCFSAIPMLFGLVRGFVRATRRRFRIDDEKLHSATETLRIVQGLAHNLER